MFAYNFTLWVCAVGAGSCIGILPFCVKNHGFACYMKMKGKGIPVTKLLQPDLIKK